MPGYDREGVEVPDVEYAAFETNSRGYDVSLCGRDINQLANIAVKPHGKNLAVVRTDHIECVPHSNHAVECLIRFKIVWLRMGDGMCHDEVA